MAAVMTINSFWPDKAMYDDAERTYYERMAKLQNGESDNVQTEKEKGKKSKAKKKTSNPVDDAKPILAVTPQVGNGSEKKESKKNKNKNKCGTMVGGGGGGSQQKSSLVNEVAKAREHIKSSLESANLAEKRAGGGSCSVQCIPKEKLSAMEVLINTMVNRISSLESELAALKLSVGKPSSTSATKAEPAKTASPSKPAKDDDDDVDLFGSESEEEDEEAKQLKEKRLAEYAAKKSKKPALIAKSSIILDVKPWDDETDMKALESAVRAIEMDGLLWGASKLVPLAYGIHKLQITCVVEDDKVSVDLLTENIEAVEDLVQSVDIAAFNKI